MNSRSWVGWLLVAVACSVACQSKNQSESTMGTESHFLKACATDGDCAELLCLGGLCSLICQSDGDCAGLADESRCESDGDVEEASCMLACDTPIECDGTAADACNDGRCGTAASPSRDEEMLADGGSKASATAEAGASRAPKADGATPPADVAVSSFDAGSDTEEGSDTEGSTLTDDDIGANEATDASAAQQPAPVDDDGGGAAEAPSDCELLEQRFEAARSAAGECTTVADCTQPYELGTWCTQLANTNGDVQAVIDAYAAWAESASGDPTCELRGGGSCDPPAVAACDQGQCTYHFGEAAPVGLLQESYVDACPGSVPAADSCDDGRVCTYGDVPRPTCRERIGCVDGRWAEQPMDCVPSYPTEACPSGATQRDSCDVQGSRCSISDGTECRCGGVGDLRWGCDLPKTDDPACPPVTPNTGTECSEPGHTCQYSRCEVYGRFIIAQCTDAGWVWSESDCGETG